MKKTKKIFILFILLISLCLMFLSGCDDNGEEEIIEPDEFVEDVPDEPMPFPLFIGDVEIERSPQRIVSLSPSLTEIIYELGYGSRLTGRSSYCDFPPVVLEVPDAGSGANPDIDRIISLSPSLLLTTSPISAMDMFRMEQSGIKTLLIPASASLNDLRDTYRALGLVFEGLFTGAEAGDNAFSGISQACDNTRVINIGRFVYITGGMKAATGDTLESSVFSCFGENVAANAINYDFDFEALLENQPDVILLNDIYSIEDLLANEFFKELDAVASGRIILIDNSAFERPSSRLVQLIEEMLADFRDL
ncbi:MAG: helical backbone metal receptor [Oscillospiraceae bacterium]|nr:helical backbone metal receptor [Oscillospiraceae bacterium]